MSVSPKAKDKPAAASFQWDDPFLLDEQLTRRRDKRCFVGVRQTGRQRDQRRVGEVERRAQQQ